MEDYSHLGVNSSSRGSFLFTSSALAPISAGYGRPSGGHSMMQQQPLPMSSFHHQPTSCFFSEASPSVKSEGGGRLSAHQQLQDFQYPFVVRGVGGGGEDHGHGPVHAQQLHGSGSSSEVDAIKAKIIAHPQYSSLLEAYVDCQKVGAPPEVAARLAAIGQEYEARQRATVGCRDPTTDPELDQFMEAYYDMLVKYREELTRPIQEATDFMKRIESQLNVLTNGSVRVFNSDEKCEEVGSSEEEQDGSGEETQVPDIDPRAEDRELKNHLLKKYSGYLGSLKQELSKKRKKGKLPKEARQKLLSWWELHYKWPYPSEAEKVALAESTGLDQKQINNWFINQRKRHWKPSEDMQFMVMDGLHPHGAAVYMDHGHFIGDASYRLGS